MSWIDMFGIIETLNGDAMRANDIIEMCVSFRNKYKNQAKKDNKNRRQRRAHPAHSRKDIYCRSQCAYNKRVS